MALSGFITRLLALVCLLLATIEPPDAGAQDIVLDQPKVDFVLAYGTIVEIPDARERLSLAEARARLDTTGRPAPGPAAGAVPVPGPVWLQLTLANPSDTTTLRRFVPNGYIAPYDMEAWRVDEATGPRLILRQVSYDGSFADRFPQNRNFMSEAFAVPPRGTAEIWLHLPYGYYTNAPFFLMEEQAFIDAHEARESFHSFLFGMRAALLIAIFAFAAILRQRTAFYYGLFALLIYGYFLANYGYLYAFVVKHAPAAYVVEVLLGGLAMTAFTFMTRTFLNARSVYPRFNRILMSALGVSWILGLLAAFILNSAMANIVLLAAIILIAAVNLTGAVLAVVNRHRGAGLFFTAAAFMFGLSGFGAVARHTNALPFDLWTKTVHIGFTIDTILFAAALVVQTLGLRQERDDAAQAELSALREKAHLSDQLTSVTAAHDRALRLAEAQRRRAASTAHDLKQPLLSLRMALARGEQDETVGEGLSYLESVIERDLNDARPPSPATPDPGAPGTIPAAKLIDSVTMMFGDEAASRSITLAGAPTDLQLRGDPVILMRLLTNLVANAVKHTNAGRITVSAAETDGTARLDVSDTGTGIPEDALASLFDPYVKSERSAGEGLGLFVVRSLAEDHGWSIEVQSAEGEGSTFSITGIALAGATA